MPVGCEEELAHCVDSGLAEADVEGHTVGVDVAEAEPVGAGDPLPVKHVDAV